MGAVAEDQDQEVDHGQRHQRGQGPAPHHFPRLAVFARRRLLAGARLRRRLILAVAGGVAAVAVAVDDGAQTLERRPVEHDTEHPAAGLAEAPLGQPGLLLVGLADREDDDRAVGDARQQRRVGDGQQRRGVEHDEVVARELLQQQLHAVGAQELARVVRHAAGGHHLEVLDAGLLEGLVGGDVADEHLGQADLRVDAVDAGDHGPAQVGVDEDGLLAGVGEDAGQVGRHRGLALALVGAGDHHRADRVVDVDEAEVGAQLAEGLGRGAAVGGVDALGLTAVEVLDVGHDGQHRGLDELLDLVDRAQLAVEVHADERREVAEQDAGEPTEQEVARVVGRVRRRGQGGVVDRLQPHQALEARALRQRLVLGRPWPPRRSPRRPPATAPARPPACRRSR